ncbi:PREDICTED: protein FAM111A, partial [Chrysochloris asiatica]|uniref:Protein FAM111A n=1 Tax=Chrysochloris asiatica TaxID=185453 RepID=A0A9B0X344_CHRAS
IETQQNKEMLVLGRQGIEGYLNLGMPLSCIPEMSHLEITFVTNNSKQGNQTLFRHDETVTAECIKFYIYAIGKGRKRIVKRNRLHNKGCKLCVYAFKGETIKEALCKDGRFLTFLENDDWKLIESLECVLESTQSVDDLEGKFFEVEFEKKMSLRATASQNSESEQRDIHVTSSQIVDQYPSLKGESDKIRKHFNQKMKANKNKKSLFNLHKANFGKLVSNSITIKDHKCFSHFGQSVGYIYSKNFCGTCFVLKGPYIITCQHVIDMIIGDGVEQHLWLELISKYARVTFDYEDYTEKEKNSFFLDSFLLTGATLDYCILKLKENGQQVPSGLYNRIASIPHSGLVYIIGHPYGKEKSTDNCCVIPLGQREKACQDHYLQNKEAVDSSGQFVHMHTMNSFKNIFNNPHVITYDTSFYFGSSGSPVFDPDFSLVAMHTAGFAYNYGKGNICSIIEFGISLGSILQDIKENHREWYESKYMASKDIEMISDED